MATISTKKELSFYIRADRMMNRGKFIYSWKDRFKQLLTPDYIMDYLETMRKCAYYERANRFLKLYYSLRYKRLGIKLGFSIDYHVCGYGLVIPHYGTIVVGGGGNKLGNYCVLHTSTCISANGKSIGDALYLATGAKITTRVVLGNSVSVGANSLVNKSFPEGNLLLGGMPAIKIKDSQPWYIRDGKEYENKVKAVEEEKARMRL